MNRRSMLGVLGLGAAAGPSIASEFVNQGSATAATPIGSNIGYAIRPPKVVLSNPVEELVNLKTEYDLLTGDPSTWIRDYIAREMDEYVNYPSFRFESIDPDIRSMKSFSESAKIRMYFERKARRKFESKKSSLLRNIQGMMGFHNEL